MSLRNSFMKERNSNENLYRSKKIEAEPMTRGDYNTYRGWQIPTDENPADEGYHVKHADGHESWSPKEDFENTFLEKGKDLLNDTALLMSSEDYKERFIAEYQQLVIRYKRLKKMLDAWDKGELKFAPTCPRSAYNMQIKAMADYIAVLESRAFIEGIELFAEQKASD